MIKDILLGVLAFVTLVGLVTYIEALKKQIPKEPIDKIMYKECPKCGSVDLGRYCMECGQAIKWE